MEENLIAQFRLLAGTEHVEALPDDDVVAFTRDLAFPLFNAICGARFAAGSEARRTAELVDGYVARGLPFLWWATPSTMTPEMDAVLRDRGIDPRPEPGMHVRLAGPVDTRLRAGVDISLSPVTEELVAVMASGFGFPDFVVEPLRLALADFGPDVLFHVVARVDGEAVSTGSVFVTGRTAGVYNIATGRVGQATRPGVCRHRHPDEPRATPRMHRSSPHGVRDGSAHVRATRLRRGVPDPPVHVGAEPLTSDRCPGRPS